MTLSEVNNFLLLIILFLSEMCGFCVILNAQLPHRTNASRSRYHGATAPLRFAAAPIAEAACFDRAEKLHGAVLENKMLALFKERAG